MPVTTFEGTVENGHIRLAGNVRLPENARVYVVLPDSPVRDIAHILSPRLKHASDANDFRKEVHSE